MLLLAGVAVAVVLRWIVPAGSYQRRTDAASGREVVVPGTYARGAASSVGSMAAPMAVPRAIVAGADVILTVLFVGGAFGLLDARARSRGRRAARSAAQGVEAPAAGPRGLRTGIVLTRTGP